MKLMLEDWNDDSLELQIAGISQNSKLKQTQL